MAAKRDLNNRSGIGFSPTTQDITGSSVRQAEKMERLKKQVRRQAKKLTLLRKGLKRFTLRGSWVHDFKPGKRVITREWNYSQAPWDFAEGVLKEERAIK